MLGETILILLARLIVIVVALPVHEFAHAKLADLLGDDTPRREGRLSLNPINHYDLVGTTLLLFFGFGWGKPVMVNPYAFRNPRQAMMLISLWGPLANIITALVSGLLTRVSLIFGPEIISLLLKYIVEINLMLAFFNLIPVPPLDGSKVLSGLLPRQQAWAYESFVGRYGLFLLILIIFPIFNGTSLLWFLIRPPIEIFTRLFTGVGI